MTRTETAVLLSILAAQDAIWTPNRKIGRSAVLYERRRLHATGQPLPWSSQPIAGKDDARRKAVSRCMADLADNGLLSLDSAAFSRADRVRLTPDGEAAARDLAGLPPLAICYPWLDALADLTEPYHRLPACWHHGETFTAQWHDEWSALGVDPAVADARQELLTAQLFILPLLTAGLVVSGATVPGHVFYALTPSGQTLADDRRAAGRPEADDSRPKATKTDATFYDRSYVRELAGLDTAEPENSGEIGELPLPVGRYLAAAF